jgi:hypothetical protein
MQRKMSGAIAGVLVIGLGWMLAGCDDDESTAPNPTPFSFSFDGLPSLASGQYYEAWVSFPEESGRALHGDEVRASLGQFIVTGSGEVESRAGGPAAFEYSGDEDLGFAVDVFVTVETEGDTAHGPALLGGAIQGDDSEGRATLLTSHHDAVGTDFSTAAGSFILATPTDGLGTNENQGIWFTDPSGAPSLTLPTLGEGWIYHAHTFHGGHSHSVGTFSAPNLEDSDGRGPEAGPEPGFTAPGSDFLTSAPDLADGATTAYIVIQPVGDVHEAEARVLHDSSFPMRVLETAIAAGATPRQSIALGQRATPWPTGSVSFAR